MRRLCCRAWSPGRIGSSLLCTGGCLVVLATAVAGCSTDREPDGESVKLATVDSVLAELGGPPTASLDRTQRWRMISSMGVGLPPRSFSPDELPDRQSRGAGLLRAYCAQCHWLPAPQMHVAAEWPLLVRRMLMRARVLTDRMGGPLTAELVGDEMLLAGMSVATVPSVEEAESLIEYLQAHSLQHVESDEVLDGPDAELFVEQCAICHETPSPGSHTAAGWGTVVRRMRANMALMDVAPLTREQESRIIAFLENRAAR